MKLPTARFSNIVVQELGNEVLVYDLTTHKVFSLNQTSTAVYQACDGQTTFEQLKIKTEFTDDLILLALDQLGEENLLAEDNSSRLPLKGWSRREAIKKFGLSTMIALPVIKSLIAPQAAMAQSGRVCTGGCTCLVGNIPGDPCTPHPAGTCANPNCVCIKTSDLGPAGRCEAPPPVCGGGCRCDPGNSGANTQCPTLIGTPCANPACACIRISDLDLAGACRVP